MSNRQFIATHHVIDIFMNNMMLFTLEVYVRSATNSMIFMFIVIHMALCIFFHESDIIFTLVIKLRQHV